MGGIVTDESHEALMAQALDLAARIERGREAYEEVRDELEVLRREYDVVRERLAKAIVKDRPMSDPDVFNTICDLAPSNQWAHGKMQAFLRELGFIGVDAWIVNEEHVGDDPYWLVPRPIFQPNKSGASEESLRQYAEVVWASGRLVDGKRDVVFDVITDNVRDGMPILTLTEHGTARFERYPYGVLGVACEGSLSEAMEAARTYERDMAADTAAWRIWEGGDA